MKKVVRLTERDLMKIVKRVINENDDMMDSDDYQPQYDRDMESGKDTIRIPMEYSGVRMELGSRPTPEDIISAYNDTVEEGIPLVSYSDGVFYNEDDNELPVDSVLDELNYAIVGEEDEEEDYDDNNRQSFEDTGRHLGWFNPRRLKEDEDLKVNETDISKMSNTQVYDLFIKVVTPNIVKVMDLLKQMKSSSKEDSVDINMLQTFVESIKKNTPITPKNYMGKRLKTAGKFTQQIINKFKK